MVVNTHKEYLEAMGVEVWVHKENALNGIFCAVERNLEKDNERCERARNFASNQNAKSIGDEVKWQDLEQQAKNCILCALSKSRTNVVFGVGNRHAEVMLIGEAPGANEDLQGEPFVGRAGMLLNAMLLAIGKERSTVYIANILKCRPPNNRDPLPQEVALCTPYLQRQIALIRPKVIIAVGRIAAQFLLNTSESMGRLRGRMHYYGDLRTPLFVIYHPAYLLRSPSEKSKAYDDLIRIQNFLRKNKLSVGFPDELSQ